MALKVSINIRKDVASDVSVNFENRLVSHILFMKYTVLFTVQVKTNTVRMEKSRAFR